MRKLQFSLILLLSSTFSLFGQSKSEKTVAKNKGKFFVYWGWNRGAYSKSDIHFKGTNYDFDLYDVKATDKQSKFSFDTYLNPKFLTVPQFNTRIGYNISEHFSVSLGDDHMKYLMTQNQIVKINGEIAVTNYPKYNSKYDFANIALAEDFLMLQHCDGLNYLNAELRHFTNHVLLKNSKRELISIMVSEGVGIGALMPRTRATLLTNMPNHEFHFAGYGLNGILSLNVQFFERFFIQTELKGGYINMPDIITTMDHNDRASQHFWFMQRNLVFGYSFRI